MRTKNAAMPWLLQLVLVLCLLFVSSQAVEAAAEKSRGYATPPESKLFKKSVSYTPIQPLIDATPPNGELVLEAGQYSGPLQIDKPITITGKAGESIVHIVEEEQAIVLQSDDIRLSSITIADDREEPAAAVITGEGRSGVVLESLHIQTKATAIEWRDMKQSKLLSNVLAWNGESYLKQSSRGNGIYLYNSSDIVVEQNEIAAMYDGVYAENSERLTLQGNQVSDSRYAYHMMYAAQVEIAENRSTGNVTGLMIMTSDQVKLHHNVLEQHQANANAAAILIYDVVEAEVYSNQIWQNRIGISVERSEAVSVHHNELLHNFVALQMQRADGLKLEHNDFVGNVTNIWDDGSTEPVIQKNYWDTLQGLDTNGDGYSELAYESAPFFLSLIERRPSFQLLFGTPGIAFIEQLYAADREQWIADRMPSMNQQSSAAGASGQGIQWGMLLVWSVLGAAGIYIIVKVRRYEQ